MKPFICLFNKEVSVIMNLKHKFSEQYDNIKLLTRKKISPFRKKNINDDSFSIISNNCWAGIVYQRYGLPYSSPTAGLYFFADDYIRMLSKLEYYMSIPMKIIPIEESEHKEIILHRHHEIFPIGKIDDVEVVFRHYSTPEEAIEKWERRKTRINYDNLIIKFSNMNLCSDELLRIFISLPFEIKFAFVTKRNNVNDKCLICYNEYAEMDYIPDDTKHYSRYIDLNELINKHSIVAKKTDFWR